MARESYATQAGIFRFWLNIVLKALPMENRDHMLERVAADITSLRDLWGPNFSVGQRDTIDSYEVVEFMIRESRKLVRPDQAGMQKLYYFCRKCELPVLELTPENGCPSCGFLDWIEITGV